MRSSIREEGPTGRLALEGYTIVSTTQARSSSSSAATRDKFQRARDLIKAKKYEEARAILETINHPRAQEWLSRIDDLEIGELGNDEF